MKKTFTVFVGLTAGLLAVLCINEIIKGTLALIMLGSPLSFMVSGISLKAVIPPNVHYNSIILIFIYFSPLLISIIFIESTFFIIPKILNERIKIGILVFQLVNLGYLIFNIMFGIITILFNVFPNSGWLKLLTQLNYSYNQRLILMFFILLIILAYVNLALKNLRKFIPIIR